MTKPICSEIKEAYPDVDFSECENLADYIQKVFSKTGETFIVIIDEYDVLIREQVDDAESKKHGCKIERFVK